MMIENNFLSPIVELFELNFLSLQALSRDRQYNMNFLQILKQNNGNSSSN